jgi:hypothetical protein
MVRDAESLKLFRFVSHLLLRSFRRHLSLRPCMEGQRREAHFIVFLSSQLGCHNIVLRAGVLLCQSLQQPPAESNKFMAFAACQKQICKDCTSFGH